MPSAPDFSKFIDAGAQFVAMSSTEARRRAQELVSSGLLAQSQVQSFVDDLVIESRRRTDELLDAVRREVQRQVTTLGIATKEDLDRLEVRIEKKAAKSAKKAATGAKASKGKARSTAPSKKSTEKPAKKSAEEPASNGVQAAQAL
ncbi:MAG: hypothetical protein EXQ69_01715 [Acidimicrobiia bacterium]|nr:hypothetical protein [Acidimicrobiia bacterium]